MRYSEEEKRCGWKTENRLVIPTQVCKSECQQPVLKLTEQHRAGVRMLAGLLRISK